jgi:flagellar hook-length control protein FliK
MSSPVAAVSTPVDVASATAASAPAASGGPVDFAALLLSAQGTPAATSALEGETVAALLGEGTGDDADEPVAAGDPASLLAAFLAHMNAPAMAANAANAGGADLRDGKGADPEPGIVALDLSLAGKKSAAPEDAAAGLLGVEPAAAKLADSKALTADGAAPRFDGLLPHGLAGAGGPGHQNTPVAGTPATHVATPLHDGQWGADFGQRLIWMANNDLQTAQISITPANLGPIEVTLNIGSDQATAVFSSPFSDVRETLESALPRLREMLAEAGINLGQAQVSAQSRRDPGESAQQGGTTGNGPRGDILRAETAVNVRSTPLRMQRGLIDTFA